MDELFVKVFSNFNEDNDMTTLCVPIESVITLFTYKYCDSKIQLHFVKCENEDSSQIGFTIKLANFTYNIINERDLPVLAKACILPVIVADANTVIAGICSISRQIIKVSQNYANKEHVAKLLGFRNACLMAPNESSIWTKFCEIDIIATLKSLLVNDLNATVFEIPVDVARFECHLRQPVRAHNVYKLALDMSKDSKNMQNYIEEDSHTSKVLGIDIKMTNSRVCKQRHFKSSKTQPPNVPASNLLQLVHKFAEGVHLTLADVIIFPCFHIIWKCIAQERLISKLPLTIQWYNDVMLEYNGRFKHSIDFLCFPEKEFNPAGISLPIVGNYSLYKSDPKRYKPRNRNYTKQDDIENVLQLVSDLSIDIKKSIKKTSLENDFDLKSLPYEALPEGGNLPEKRCVRKAEQLENLVKATIEVARPGDHIIDFCSGSGHLGIIIAITLPKCNVSLLENKEESLNRAKVRVHKLGLTNVSFFQCNLDFFKADFQIGVSLHACGVASDLVMQHCIERRADFICCPCCYGNVHDCHHLTYPRSEVFKRCIRVEEYLILGHGADQTHDVENVKTAQGEICMDYIDKDRCLKARECGYDVVLRKLDPPTCTPKNNLLIGVIRK